MTNRLPSEVPPAVATFLNLCDEIIDAKLPMGRLGTSLVKGKLTLYLGDSYLQSDEEQKIDDLKHETGHFVLQHLPRCGERDKIRFNLVCDASLAYQGINITLPTDVTFDKLPCKHGGTVPPSAPEVAYDLLAENPSGESCGSLIISFCDDTPESKAKLAIIGAIIKAKHPDFLQFNGAGNEAGTGRSIPEIPPQPPWIRSVLDYLLKTTRSLDRRRSWRREHRALPDLLPGRSRSYDIACRILYDASGSISQELSAQFLGAIANTPELAGSDVVVFDTKISKPIPVNNIKAICDKVEEMGGGTAIKKAGMKGRLLTVPIVWLTDCESGDGFPPPHDTVEIWCVSGSANHPHGIRVQVD